MITSEWIGESPYILATTEFLENMDFEFVVMAIYEGDHYMYMDGKLLKFVAFDFVSQLFLLKCVSVVEVYYEWQ